MVLSWLTPVLIGFEHRVALQALDTMSEETVMNELENVRGGKTMIMIAHKLNTVRWADRIVVVDG